MVNQFHILFNDQKSNYFLKSENYCVLIEQIRTKNFISANINVHEFGYYLIGKLKIKIMIKNNTFAFTYFVAYLILSVQQNFFFYNTGST